MTATVPPERRMANDIAVNLGHLPEESAAEAVAAHIGRFWDPRMRSRLLAHTDEGAEGLHPLVIAAVRLLRGSRTRENGPRAETGTTVTTGPAKEDPGP
ncbi:formate dehydrogenase subunit delta [Streptomyces sp. NPDC058751]|uniref:formate dehydrogenase subunit delta n=1 Tax=Streptomyces sp. NPDC058751 TaxID=3346623 RepID=UPI00369D1067